MQYSPPVTTREFRARLSKRARRADVALDEALLTRLEIYYRLLSRWNTKINLTALPLEDLTDHAVDRLLIEPLAAARFVPESPLTWFDLGSGGGSPALPLKLVRPAAKLAMVESKARKAAFLREAVRALSLEDAEVENARSDDVVGRPDSRRVAQLVTVRAVKVDKRLVRALEILLSSGGRALLFSAAPAGAHAYHRLSLVQATKLTGSETSDLTILRAE